jgi:hypothetical protein
MEIAKYFKEFDEATKAQDHYKMIATMQKFFNEIHKVGEKDVLSYYSLASQFELLGMEAKTIKDAVIARVKSQYDSYPATWRQAAVGLNALLIADSKSHHQIVI